MNLRARFCMMGSALTLSLLCAGGVSNAQTPASWSWTPYDYDASKARAIQAINDADLSKQDIAGVLGLLRDLRDSENDYMMAKTITAEDLTAHMGTQSASHEMRVSNARTMFMSRKDSIWKTIHERLGDRKAYAIHDLVEVRSTPAMSAGYTSDRIRRIDEILTWWDNRHSGQVVTATTITTDTTGRAHRDMSMSTMGVAPLTHRELVNLMEAKLIAMAGSHDAAWMLQGMHADVGSDDIKFARERKLRVWEWR